MNRRSRFCLFLCNMCDGTSIIKVTECFLILTLSTDHLNIGDNIAITSTGYPQRYLPSLLETWLFTSESGFSVTFIFFETEQGSDSVTIANGLDNVGVPIAFSGNIDANSSYIFSSDKTLNVTFSTNSNVEHRGFKALISGINISSVREYIL